MKIPDINNTKKNTMRDELIVENNRTVSINAIYQWPTYGGMLEGLPTERINKSILDQLPQSIKKHCGNKVFHIITPVQTPIKYEGHYSFGTPMRLPSITSVVEFSDFQPAKDMRRDGSELVIAWFQDEYVFPVDPAIVEALKHVEWSKLATDFDY